MQITPNFSLAELTVTNTGLVNRPSAAEQRALKDLATNVLQPLREALGRPMVVSSGFRNEAVNRAVGGASTSQHRFGQAADFTVPGMTPREVVEKIVDLGLPFDQVIQEFGRWVHVSFGPRHRRQVLTAKKINGRTEYQRGLT